MRARVRAKMEKFDKCFFQKNLILVNFVPNLVNFEIFSKIFLGKTWTKCYKKCIHHTGCLQKSKKSAKKVKKS